MTRVQGCVFLLCDLLHPSPFYASGASSPCMGVSCSDSGFPGARFLGDWNPAPPPCPSPGGGTPAWPSFPTASAGDVSGPHLGLLGSLEVQTGSDRAGGKGGGGALLAGVIL